jgi:hypothetical protein
VRGDSASRARAPGHAFRELAHRRFEIDAGGKHPKPSAPGPGPARNDRP